MRHGTALAFILALTICSSVSAQEKPVPKPNAPPAAAQSKKPPAAQPEVVIPEAEKIVLLLRTTLITLNDAIQTGNFTVLRDRGAPGFRDINTAARLSQAFSDLAVRGIDLSAVSVIAPQLTEPPSLNQQSRILRLKGYFPGEPVQINFDMLYQAVDGRWRLFGLSVQPSSPLDPADSVSGSTESSASKN